jgi:hypothetical protein
MSRGQSRFELSLSHATNVRARSRATAPVVYAAWAVSLDGSREGARLASRNLFGQQAETNNACTGLPAAARYPANLDVLALYLKQDVAIEGKSRTGRWTGYWWLKVIW